MPQASRRRRSPPSRRSAKSRKRELRIVEAAKGKIGRTVRTFAEQLALPAGGSAAGGGEYLAATKSIVGRETVALLSELLPKILIALTWQKTMRWGAGTGPWVRPVHGVVALFEGQVVPFDLFGIQAGRESAGHSTLSPKSFPVKGVEDYLAALAERDIVVFPAERKKLLGERMAARAQDLGGVLVEDSSLLDKLAAICEIPGVMEGSFDAGSLCAAARGAGDLPAGPPERVDGGEGRAHCCRSS